MAAGMPARADLLAFRPLLANRRLVRALGAVGESVSVAVMLLLLIIRTVRGYAV